MERTGDHNRAVLRLIFAASFASLAYELALMRIFSISLWYHFAFMVISIAMLGIGASGTVLSVVPALKDVRRLPAYTLLLGAAITGSYLLANSVPFDPARLSWDRLQLLLVGLYYCILSVPFFCFGLIVAAAYSSLTAEANAIYAADLLGAGMSALALVWLLSLGGPERTVLILSALLAAVLLTVPAGRMLRALSLVLIIANIALFLLHPAFYKPRISAYKAYSLAMQFPGAEQISTTCSPYARVDLFRSPAVRFAPGLSFTYRRPLPDQIGLAVDAGDLYAVTGEQDDANLDFVKALPSSIAWRLGSNQDVLIIEPRTGVAILQAKAFHTRNIAALDSNPAVLRALRKYERSKGIVGAGRQAQAGLARTWLAASGRTFDVIDLSLMGSWPSAAFGFAEDYRFTVEAFERYLAGLKPGGFLSLNLYILPPPRTELRLLATLAESARALGIGDFPRHVAALRSWDTVTVLVKRSVLTAEDIRRIKAFSREMRFDLVYYPGVTPPETNVYIRQRGNEYAEAFSRMLDGKIRPEFMSKYLFDIAPATDEKPFFHYYLKIGNLREIFRVMGGKWQYFIEEGYLLPVLFVQALFMSAVLILLPLAGRKSRERLRGPQRVVPALAFFGLLGVAYLFVEIAFIQKMILVLENPSFAATTVIASLLAGSGIGSLLSTRMPLLGKPPVLLFLAMLVIAAGLLLPGAFLLLSRTVMAARVVSCVLLLLPVGLLMGIPFPLGLSQLGKTSPGLVPWAWAVNGCCSVIAPIVAIMLALSVGYQWVLFSGAAAYGAAFLILRGLEKGHEVRSS